MLKIFNLIAFYIIICFVISPKIFNFFVIITAVIYSIIYCSFNDKLIFSNNINKEQKFLEQIVLLLSIILVRSLYNLLDDFNYANICVCLFLIIIYFKFKKKLDFIYLNNFYKITYIIFVFFSMYAINNYLIEKHVVEIYNRTLNFFVFDMLLTIIESILIVSNFVYLFKKSKYIFITFLLSCFFANYLSKYRFIYCQNNNLITREEINISYYTFFFISISGFLIYNILFLKKKIIV